jgi:hypothetical protein
MWVNFKLVGWSVENVNMAAIGLPARHLTSGEMPMGMDNTTIMFLLELVGGRARRRVAVFPELLNELFAFLVVGRRRKAVRSA